LTTTLTWLLTQVIEEEGFEEIKVKYYNMMVEFHTHDHDSWEIGQCYFKIYDTSTTKADEEQLRNALESCITFVLVSKFDNHQVDLVHRLKALKDISVLHPVYGRALQLFSTKEIIPSPFGDQDRFEKHACLSRFGDADTEKHFVDLFRKRVIQHNLRVVAGYYRRIRFQRLCELLGLDLEQLEMHLSELASSGDSYLKIDRPSGIVCFGEPRAAAGILSDWASDIGKMLNLMESTCHLIRRENMVHKL
jgi:26S proteasome regulatory subunit N5